MNIRISARALLINPEGQILLLKTNPDVFDPSGKIKSPYWITPGGGVEFNETPAQAIAREVYEECGIDNLDIGPMVWFWEHVLVIGGIPTQLQDHFFVIRTVNSRVSIDGMNLYEREDFREYRWWKAEEIQSSTDIFAPPGLGQLLEDLLMRGSEGMQIINIP